MLCQHARREALTHAHYPLRSHNLQGLSERTWHLLVRFLTFFLALRLRARALQPLLGTCLPFLFILLPCGVGRLRLHHGNHSAQIAGNDNPVPGAMGVCKHQGECEHRIHW
jgi:hypothetical protein